MKKKIVILSLLAIFMSVNSLSAQTKTVTTKTVVKTENKAVTPACCKGKSAECCKGKTQAEKTKCIEKCTKETAKVGTKTCNASEKGCSKKVVAKKVETTKTVSLK